jgi:hypothetical protein
VVKKTNRTSVKSHHAPSSCRRWSTICPSSTPFLPPVPLIITCELHYLLSPTTPGFASSAIPVPPPPPPRLGGSPQAQGRHCRSCSEAPDSARCTPVAPHARIRGGLSTRQRSVEDGLMAKLKAGPARREAGTSQDTASESIPHAIMRPTLGDLCACMTAATKAAISPLHVQPP